MAFVENNVKIKKGEDEITLKQRVTLTKDYEHELEFVSEIGDKVTSIFSVDKNADGSYQVNLNELDIFKDENGKSFSEIFPGISFPALKADSSKISMSTNGEELIFEFTGVDGKTGKIRTTSTNITIEIDGKSFLYSTNNENAIDVNMSTTTVEAFLDKENKLFDTPSDVSKFPSYFVGLYGRSLTGNTEQSFGDYTITSFENENDSQPFVFLSKEAKGPKTINYFYVDGLLKKCTGKFLLQYDEIPNPEKPGEYKKVPYLVVETASSNNVKKGELPKLNYYSIPLKTTEDGKIADSCIQGLDMLLDSTHSTIASGSGRDVYKIASETTPAREFKFDKKDDRAYTKYEYRLKPKTFKITEALANKGDSEKDKSDSDEKEKPEQEVPEKEKPALKEKEGDKAWKKDYKKQVENLGWTGFMVGMFLVAAAMLTGFAVLSVVGLALCATGVTGVTFADKFVFEGYIRKAKTKISEYETQEFEDEQFAENFASQEALLDDAMELSLQEQNKLEQLFTVEGSALQAFANEYNSYGVGFEGTLQEGEERILSLCGYDGLERKSFMAESLREISLSSDSEQREALISRFINQHFAYLPKENEEKVREIFNPRNHRELESFITALDKTVVAQKAEKEIYDAQKAELATADDSKLRKIVQTKKFNSAQRAEFFERYDAVIIRHLSSRETPTQESIDKLIEKIPESDKKQALDILSSAAERIESEMTNVSLLAEKNHKATSKIRDCERILTGVIEAKKSDLMTASQVQDVAEDYFKHITAFYHMPNTKTGAALKGHIEKITDINSKTSDSSKAKQVISQMITILRFNSDEVNDAYSSLLEAIKEDGRLYENIVKLYEGSHDAGIIPDLTKTPSKEFTLEKVGNSLGNTNVQDACIRLDQTKQAELDAMKDKISNLIDSLAELDEEIGFSPAIKPSEITAELAKVKLANKLTSLEPALLKKIAIAQIKARKIQAVAENDKITAEIKELYSQTCLITQLATSRKLTTLTFDNAVTRAIGIEEVTTADLKTKGKNLKTSISKHKKAVKIIRNHTANIDTTTALEKFEDLESSEDAKTFITKYLLENYSNLEFNPNLSLEQVVELVQTEGKIDATKVTQFIERERHLVNDHTVTNLFTMSNDLGEELIQKLYNTAIDDAKRGLSIEERYDSVIDILVKRFGLNEAELKREFVEGELNIEELIEKFLPKYGRDDEPEDIISGYSKKRIIFDNIRSNHDGRTLRENVYTDEDRIKVWEADSEVEALALTVSEFDMAWEEALDGNFENLNNIQDSHKQMLVMAGINIEEIDEILAIPNLEEKQSKLQILERKLKVSKLVDKLFNKKVQEVKELHEYSSLPTEEDRELNKGRKELQTFEKNKKEFETKIDFLLDIEDESLREQAIEAFLEGNGAFFEINGLTCKGYEFGENDLELLSALDIKKAKLLKAKKRFTRLSKINEKLAKNHEYLKTKVEKLQEKADKETEKKAVKLENISMTKAKDNVSLIKTIFANLIKKNETVRETESPESSAEHADEITGEEEREEDREI